MKNLILIPVLAAVIILSGCKSGPGILSPSLVQQGVATGVSYSSAKYPQAVPFLRAAADVICSAANGTNLAPADVVAAIESSPSTAALKTPEGTLIINSALMLYIGVWNSYGSNALASAPQIQPYLKATCDGTTEGLPSPNLGVMRLQAARGAIEKWPLVK